MPLEENVEHETVLIYRSPQPVSNAVHGCAHLVQVPSGTPSGFAVTQVFNEEGSEFDTPFAQGFVADLDAALVE